MQIAVILLSIVLFTRPEHKGCILFCTGMVSLEKTMYMITRNQCRVSHTLSISTRREAERKMLQIKQKQVSLSSVIAVYFFFHLFLSLSEFTLIHTIPNPKKQKLRNTQAVVNAERTSYRQQELGARQDFTSEYLYRVVLFNTFRAM